MASRLPSSILEASGSFNHNPDRRRVDPVSPGQDLGDPPAHLKPGEVLIWNEIRVSAPWAKSADRYVAEVACTLLNLFRTTTISSGLVSQMLLAFKSLGCTPQTRSACAQAPEKPKPEDNEFAEFAA